MRIQRSICVWGGFKCVLIGVCISEANDVCVIVSVGDFVFVCLCGFVCVCACVCVS